LERKLEEMLQQRARPARVVQLTPVNGVHDQETAPTYDGAANLTHVERIVIPVTTLRALANAGATWWVHRDQVWVNAAP